MARSFYDDPINARVTTVIKNPHQASLLLRASQKSQHISSTRTAVLQDSEAMHCVRLAQEEKLTMALKYVFEQFNKWEGGVNSSRMDKIRFHKVLRYGEVLHLPGYCLVTHDTIQNQLLSVKDQAKRCADCTLELCLSVQSLCFVGKWISYVLVACLLMMWILSLARSNRKHSKL